MKINKIGILALTLATGLVVWLLFRNTALAVSLSLGLLVLAAITTGRIKK